MMQDGLKERLEIGSGIVKCAIDYFHDNGFVQLMPVMLGMSTDPLGPDPGSSILKTPEVEYLGSKLYTMNSMILHKQLAVRDLDRLFILSPNIRLEKAEKRETKRHLFEFTQVDFEIAKGRKEDVMKLVEGFLSHLSGALSKDARAAAAFAALGMKPFEFRPPFKAYTTHELEEKYGNEWETAASMAHDQPFWAMCHKREFYEKEDEAHPGHYLNYDLIYPMGYGEALSGGEREFEYGRITRRMDADKLSMDVYKAYLDEARKGLVGSAGAGFGVERLTRFMTRADHVGDVQMFRRVPGERVVI